MSLVSSRVYKDEKDFRTIIDLIASIRPPANLNDYPVKVDIEENITSAPTHANTRLWFDNKRPIAWAYVNDFNNLCWDIDKRYEELLGAQVIEWGKACIEKTHSDRKLITLDAK